MPVLLSDERDLDTWLSSSPSDVFGLVRTIAAVQMLFVKSGKDELEHLGGSVQISDFGFWPKADRRQQSQRRRQTFPIRGTI
jgi:hypothetical protein